MMMQLVSNRLRSNKMLVKYHKPSLTSLFSTTVDDESKKYIGVYFDDTNVKKYQAKLFIKKEGTESSEKTVIDGGRHWTALDAARAYDNLARVYLGTTNNATALNFEEGQTTTTNDVDTMNDYSHNWSKDVITSKSSEKKAVKDELIPVRPGEYLSLDEVMTVLKKEKAQDIVAIDLAGKSDIASHMIFCTCRSRSHMRKMADYLVSSLVARNIELRDLPDFEFSVEGRDCHDWMIVDGNTIVVHFLDSEKRNALQLERHWNGFKDNVQAEYGHLNEEEYVLKYGDTSDSITENDLIKAETDDDDTNNSSDWK